MISPNEEYEILGGPNMTRDNLIQTVSVIVDATKEEITNRLLALGITGNTAEVMAENTALSNRVIELERLVQEKSDAIVLLQRQLTAQSVPQKETPMAVHVKKVMAEPKAAPTPQTVPVPPVYHSQARPQWSPTQADCEAIKAPLSGDQPAQVPGEARPTNPDEDIPDDDSDAAYERELQERLGDVENNTQGVRR